MSKFKDEKIFQTISTNGQEIRLIYVRVFPSTESNIFNLTAGKGT